MSTPNPSPPIRRVLVTGASGYLGAKLVTRLAARDDLELTATDLRPWEGADALGVDFVALDIRSPELGTLIGERRIEAVVHLAAIVDPSAPRELAHSVDVGGSENVITACLEHGVRRLVTTSSGAAYGYRPDHPRWIEEDHPLRADDAFAYAWHKRIVEERLAELRQTHPELEQLIFRPCTILGQGVDNAITRLFERDPLLGLTDGDDRFVLAWDEDVAACLEKALHSEQTGVYNLAGSGALGLDEIAERLGKRVRRLPPSLLRAALAVLRPLRLVPWGPEQVRFLRWRPVLSNRRLVEDFGYQPQKTSSEVFDLFMADRGLADRGLGERDHEA